MWYSNSKQDLAVKLANSAQEQCSICKGKVTFSTVEFNRLSDILLFLYLELIKITVYSKL